ncbi:MAG: two-component sensor histidine kinase, partial [Arcicella sp.]|nr:two-component sensor histidine kinase [Arcicella sp.]
MNQRFTFLPKLIFFKKNIFLILALATFGLAFLLYIITEKGPLSATEDKYLYDVQNKIQEEVESSNKDLAKVVTLVSQSKDTTFSHLKIPTIHPYFIFKNGRPIFWSDSRFVPDYQLVEGTYNLKSVASVEGKFISNRRVVIASPDNFEIFSIIELYRQYESENEHLKTGYNANIFVSDPAQVDMSPAAATHLNMYSTTKEFLFSVKPLKGDSLKNQSIPANVILLGMLSMFFLVAYLLVVIWFMNKTHRYGRAFLILLGYFLLLRATMLFYNIPFIFYESDLFNKKYYDSSLIAPSLGDLMLNLLVVIVLLIYLVNYYYKMNRYFWLMHLPDAAKKVVSIIFIVLGCAVFHGFYAQLINIYEKSNYQLDISLSIDFFDKTLKLSSLTTFILVSMVYFL